MMTRLLAVLASAFLFVANANAASEKWIAGAGAGLTWADACGAEVTTTAVTAGNAVQCSVVVTNGTALDVYARFSIHVASLTTVAGSPYVGLYIYPLNQDGTTYGDGRFGSAAAGPPLANYMACSVPAPASTTAAVEGSCSGVVLPPGSFKIVFYNNLGAATPSSGTVLKYQTYNRSVN